MSEPPEQFKRAPKRKAAKGRSVTLSPEAKQAYMDVLREKDAKEAAYGKHLPPDMKR